MKSRFWLSAGLTFLAITSLKIARAETAQDLAPYLAADLRDVKHYLHPRPAGVSRLLQALARDSRELFGQRFRRLTDVTRERQDGIVLGVQLAAVPSIHGTEGHAEVWVDTRIANRLVFRRVRLNFDRVGPEGSLQRIRVRDTEVLETVPARRLEFVGEVDLYQRQLLISSSSHPTIRRLFPLGVGMFDEGVTEGSWVDGVRRTRLVTPEFEQAFLRRRHVNTSRGGYYLDMPFMPISNGEGRAYNIAFHITMVGDPENYRPNEITSVPRGFVSNGCMRMREKDVYALFHWLRSGGSAEIPMRVSLHTRQTQAHPYPFLNNRYKRVRNFGTAENPEFRREAHEPGERELRIDEWVNHAPPSLGEIFAVDGESMNANEMRQYSEPAMETERPDPTEWWRGIPGLENHESDREATDHEANA